MRPYVRLLRDRDYALLWGGAAISALGDGMSFVAIVGAPVVPDPPAQA